MDRPGSEAVGIGAEADVNISELFASSERWRPTLQFGGVTCGAPCCYDNSRDMFVNPHRGSFVPGLRIAVAEA